MSDNNKEPFRYQKQVTPAVQFIVLFMVIVVSLFNLSRESTNHDLWTVLLTCSVGHVMPTPKFKKLLGVKETSQESIEENKKEEDA